MQIISNFGYDVSGVNMMLVAVKASSNNDIVCYESLGACGSPKQCDQRCKAMHSDGVGSCGFNSCTCVYKNNCKH
ncbi:hypothetical protein Lalb_Chr11g0074881 [Lupinus albus]|uniref:Knottin, scorpion toxin n=1 Tax=Lupinus albus TaxID=3870 RepID=A0A6A4PTH5_LUPAL|nr:hypothetical protein Lalb_Chr11g0074881 [Lupinus albus]